MAALNSCFTFLEFTTELESDYPDGYMPTLDMKARIQEDYKMTFQFYEKPTTSKYCVMEKSAMGDQEINRRLLNTSEAEQQKTRDEIINSFDDRMKVSGYNEDSRRRILRRSV